MQLGEKQTETEIETEMLVIHPILNQNLDNIHLLVNSQTQLQIVLLKSSLKAVSKRYKYRLTVLQSLWDSTGKTLSFMGSPHSFVHMSQSKGSHEAEVNFISFCLYRKEANVKSHRPWIVMMNNLVRLAHCTHLRGLGFIEFFSKLVCSAFKDKPEQHRLFELCQGCPQDQIPHPHRQ